MDGDDEVKFLEGGEVDLIDCDWNDLLEWEPPGPVVLTDSSPSSSALSNPPNASWIDEIEKLLMKDDDDDDVAAPKVSPEPADDDYSRNFLADILVGGSPGNDSDEIPAATPEEEVDDPLSRKRKRQQRNRDAAVRSRERKKMYVKELEMKSKYLEGECRRLGRLLQCCYAENHALRLGLQMGNAYAAPTTTKQESAVLFLESLLLGSLLWFLGITCLFTLPVMNPLLNHQVEVEDDEGNKAPQRVAPPREASSEKYGYVGAQSFVKTRRCKASWTRMKHFPASPSLLIR